MVNGGQFWGGELGYRLISHSGGSYLYEISFRIYRDCRSDAELPDPVIGILNTTDITRNNHYLFYREEVLSSPVTIPLAYARPGYCVINEPQDCVDLLVFTKQVVLPYSPEGYTFYYSGCCRNGLSNLQAESWNFGTEMIYGVPEGGQALTYYSKVPSHDVIASNSTPYSLHDSIAYGCQGKPLSLQFDFVDPDGDSLAYKFGGSFGETEVSTTTFFPLLNKTAFPADQPLGVNSSVTLNPRTGLLSGIPASAGRFAIVISVEEYRNGVLINIHRKEFQVNVKNCKIDPPAEVINCTGYKAFFEHTNNSSNSYSWDFGDPASADDTSRQIFPLYTYLAPGEYTVTMRVTNPAGCTDSASGLAKIYPGLKANFNWNDPICNSVPVMLRDSSHTPFGQVISWTWRAINNRSVIGNTPNIVYQHALTGDQPYPLSVQLTVQTSLGCRDSILKVVHIYPEVKADAGPDRIISFNEPYTMRGNSSGGTLYDWSPATGLSDPHREHPVLVYDRDMTYVLKVSNRAGCYDEDTVNIRYMKGPDIYVPTAFSPNNDGRNDRLHFFPVGLEIESFTIYNRWGRVVFQSRVAGEGWDGRLNNMPQDSGVFFWVAKTKDWEGNSSIKKGSVMLIR